LPDLFYKEERIIAVPYAINGNLFTPPNRESSASAAYPSCRYKDSSAGWRNTVK
jgi:hypothetical protein